MQSDIILTNPAGLTGETVARSLESKGLRVVVMQTPNARKMEDSYIARLHKFVAEYRPEAVWPIFFADVLARHRDEFQTVDIPLDSAGKILRLDDKLQCCSLAASLGIRQPRSFSSVDEALSCGKFPLVFKRSMGLGGDSVYFPGNGRALRNLVHSCIPAGEDNSAVNTAEAGGGALCGAAGALITEFIPGEDVSVDAIRWGGFFFGAAYRVIEPRRKGVSLRRVSIDAPQQVATLRRILDAVDYRGICGADFRIAPDGTSYFLECNPRFCGGLESAIASGFDIPWVYWQLTHALTPDPIDFTPGIITGQIPQKS